MCLPPIMKLPLFSIIVDNETLMIIWTDEIIHQMEPPSGEWAGRNVKEAIGESYQVARKKIE